MPHRLMTTCLGVLVGMTLLAGEIAAQAPIAADPDSIPTDSAPKPKVKGGLFGKAKKLAGNKLVQTVAKTAACTMVPGGQAIAGAIDAASAKKSASGAAEGAAAAATGSTCMPGMGGAGMGKARMAGGEMAGMTGMAGMASMAGAGGKGAALAGAGALPALVGSAGAAMPTPGLGGSSENTEGLADTPDETAVAGCMGLTVEEYREFTAPTHGENRQMTKAEMKRQLQLSKKIDQRRFQTCMMQQMSQ
jgi:hypothetical protein